MINDEGYDGEFQVPSVFVVHQVGSFHLVPTVSTIVGLLWIVSNRFWIMSEFFALFLLLFQTAVQVCEPGSDTLLGTLQISARRLVAYYKIGNRVSRVILLTLLHLKMFKNIPKPSSKGPKRFKTTQIFPKWRKKTGTIF